MSFIYITQGHLKKAHVYQCVMYITKDITERTHQYMLSKYEHTGGKDCGHKQVSDFPIMYI